MLVYVVRRLLWGAVTLWLAITLTFFGLKAAFDRLNGEALERALYGPPWKPPFSALRPMYVFEGPTHEHYLHFLGSALRLDWGYSVSTSTSVRQALQEDFPVTARIGLLAFALAVAIGIPLGVRAAGRSGWTDRAISSAATVAYTFPAVVLAMLLLALSVKTAPIFALSWGQGWRNYLRPVLVLGLGAGGYLARVAVLEVLGQEYVRAARAKGLRERTIARRHILPNALPTLLAALGPTLGLLLSGSAMLEYALNIPGTGKLLFSGFEQHDYPMILAGVTLYTALILASNLVADVLASAVNARSGRGSVARVRRRGG